MEALRNDRYFHGSAPSARQGFRIIPACRAVDHLSESCIILEERPVVWLGGSRADVRGFPADARAQIGQGLYRLQLGRAPVHWRPMPSIGPGVMEIRVRTAAQGRVDHRVFYVSRYAEAVYVLHAFRKDTRKTSDHEIRLGRQRYAEMLTIRREER